MKHPRMLGQGQREREEGEKRKRGRGGGKKDIPNKPREDGQVTTGCDPA